MPFDIGFSELLLVMVLALLVLGPERLPRAMQTFGRWAGKAKKTVSNFNHQVNRELELDQMKKKLAEHEEMIKRQAEGSDLQKLRDEAEQKIKAAEEAQAKAKEQAKDLINSESPANQDKPS
ncbi:Sec-independent protein translocase protein TatB [Kangiella sediminilitoris]|uniref:Sec-independent protein translocase protein TatB n=1 Tax=Kangiella sediminilitoris TaxID=1144748 RepID=A0A1B3B8D9_9GAMM|nr:Sec-independent protein translocase protein TatB [Kangiella sediminilitoris]AOE49069.1 Sec-independent protein translocase protein TatB [Kangiella sediminilitoris]